MLSNQRLEKLAAYSLIVAAVMLVVAYLRVDTLGPDGTNHVQWIRSFPEQVLRGDLRPTWLLEAFEGLGAPTFYFYPPLPYWVATPLYPLISELSGARGFTLLCFVASCLSFFSFRYYLQTHGVTGSIVVWSSLLYAVAPFRIYEIFSRSGLSAHFAVAFIPLIFAGIDGLIAGKSRAKYFAMLSVSLACVVLSNIPVFVMTSVVVAVYLIVLITRKTPGITNVLLAILFAASFAAFYLLPIPSIVEHVQRNKLIVVQGPPVDGVRSILNLLRLYDITESAHSTLNILTAVAMVVLLVMFYRRRGTGTSRLLFFALLCAALVTILQLTVISGPIWSIDAVRTLLQFPHRWSIILVFAAAIAYAMLDDQRLRRWLLLGVIVWGAASAGFSTLAAFDLRVHARGEIPSPLEPPEYATVYAPKDKHQVVAIAREHKLDPQIMAIRPLQQGEQLTESAHEYDLLRYDVTAVAPLPVIFQHWKWPYWKLYAANGGELTTGADSTGRMTAMLPVGQNSYELRLVESSSERTGEYITFLGLILCAAYCIYLAKQEKTRTTSAA